MLRGWLAVAALGCGSSTARPVKSAEVAYSGEQARISNGDRWTDFIVIGDRTRAREVCERLVAESLARQDQPAPRVERACEADPLPARDNDVLLVDHPNTSLYEHSIPRDLKVIRVETRPFATVVQCARALRELESSALPAATHECRLR